MAKKPSQNQNAPDADQAQEAEAPAAPETAEQDGEVAQVEQAETAAQVAEPETAAQPAAAAQLAPDHVKGKARPGSAGMVNAKLKVRWSDGNTPHQAGDVARMTRATYDRLKEFDRVE